MKNRIFSKPALLWLGLLLPLTAACDYDDTLHDTPHPAQGAILLHTGYSGEYYMKVREYCTTASQADFRCPGVFAPGSYTLSVFNLPGGMKRVGNVVSVVPLPDGTLNPQPGELRGNTTAVTLTADDTLSVTLPLKQLTRRLNLVMKLKDGNPDIVATAVARITGIAPALDLAALKLQGEPSTVRAAFKREGDLLTAELNILGISAGVEQRFTILITATDGQQQTLSRDMTGSLAAFNEGTEPLTLNATLELMNDFLPEADITDWTPAGSESGDAV